MIDKFEEIKANSNIEQNQILGINLKFNLLPENQPQEDKNFQCEIIPSNFDEIFNGQLNAKDKVIQEKELQLANTKKELEDKVQVRDA